MNKIISLDHLQRLVIAPLKKLIDKKVDKVDGKELSTNDFTNEDKEKLTSIEAGAQVNVQPDWDQTDEEAADFIKNKPIEATDDEALDMLAEIGALEAVTDADGAILTDENNNILII